MTEVAPQSAGQPPEQRTLENTRKTLAAFKAEIAPNLKTAEATSTEKTKEGFDRNYIQDEIRKQFKRFEGTLQPFGLNTDAETAISAATNVVHKFYLENGKDTQKTKDYAIIIGNNLESLFLSLQKIASDNTDIFPQPLVCAQEFSSFIGLNFITAQGFDEAGLQKVCNLTSENMRALLEKFRLGVTKNQLAQLQGAIEGTPNIPTAVAAAPKGAETPPSNANTPATAPTTAPPTNATATLGEGMERIAKVVTGSKGVDDFINSALGWLNKKFPSGYSYVVDFLASLGLKDNIKINIKPIPEFDGLAPKEIERAKSFRDAAKTFGLKEDKIAPLFKQKNSSGLQDIFEAFEEMKKEKRNSALTWEDYLKAMVDKAETESINTNPKTSTDDLVTILTSPSKDAAATPAATPTTNGKPMGNS